MSELSREVTVTIKNFVRGFTEEDSPTEAREVIEGKTGPLIIIRGFGKKSSMPEVRIREEMQKTELGGVIAGIAAGPGNVVLEKFVPELIEEINKADHKPILVGYSLGGLIALLAYHHGIREKIHGIITVASPTNGIKMVGLLKPKKGLLKDMAPGSEFLESLGNAKYHPNTYHLLAEYDQFIGNPDEITIDGAKIVLPIKGHNNFLGSQATAQSVVNLAMEILKSTGN